MPCNKATLLIDQFLPKYHFSEQHQTSVHAPEDLVYASLMNCELSRSRVIQYLFRLRGLPGSKLTIAGLKGAGFQILGTHPNRELVMGLIGRFWTRSGNIVKIAPEHFTDFNTPGYARAVLNFTMVPLHSGTVRLATETRIHCHSNKSRNLFRVYWTVIRPFSGWIRLEMLRLIKLDSERRYRYKAT
ncbi:hypothetical protein ACFL0O_10280 [Thermodesulfobacteriota bacterium]